MDIRKLVEAVLTPLLAFLLRWLFNLIGYPVSDEVLFAIVGALVAWILAQVFGAPVARLLGK